MNNFHHFSVEVRVSYTTTVPFNTVCSLWTCGSSRRNSTSGDSCSSTDSSDESAIVQYVRKGTYTLYVLVCNFATVSGKL